MYQSWNQTLVSSNAAQTAVTATSATDAAASCDYTFPANIFQVGTKFRIKATGVWTSTSGSQTLTWSVQLGATTISQALGAIALTASQTNIKFDLEITAECRAVGNSTTTTFLVQGRQIGTGQTNVVCPMPLSGVGAVGTGVDCTATQKLQLMAAFNNASNSVTIEQYEVTMLN
jgi:hypothetical protein